MYIDNREFYGLMQIPMERQNSLSQEQEQFAHIKNEAMCKSLFITWSNWGCKRKFDVMQDIS